MRLKPLPDCVIVAAPINESVSEGGIALPPDASAGYNLHHAKVLSVGPGRTAENGVTSTAQIKEGDTVIFYKGEGIPVVSDGVDYLVLDVTRDIIAFETE